MSFTASDLSGFAESMRGGVEVSLTIDFMRESSKKEMDEITNSTGQALQRSIDLGVDQPWKKPC